MFADGTCARSWAGTPAPRRSSGKTVGWAKAAKRPCPRVTWRPWIACAPGKLAWSCRCKSGSGKPERAPDSECCAVAGDGGSEAYTTILWGALLSHEIQKFAEAEAVSNVEGNMCGTVLRGADALPGRRPHHVGKERVGTWEIPRLTDGNMPPRSASGRRQCRRR